MCPSCIWGPAKAGCTVACPPKVFLFTECAKQPWQPREGASPGKSLILLKDLVQLILLTPVMDIWLNADHVMVHKCSFLKSAVDKNPLHANFSGIAWDLAACLLIKLICLFITTRILAGIRGMCLLSSHNFYLRCFFNKAVYRSVERKGFQIQKYT